MRFPFSNRILIVTTGLNQGMPVLVITVHSVTARAAVEAHMRMGSVPASHPAKRVHAHAWDADNLGVM
jgi:hypothetical protein